METKLDDKQKRIILSWHKLSEENSDYYIKFISEWIAFNAICYGLYYEDALKRSAQINKEKGFEEILENLKKKRNAKKASLEPTDNIQKFHINIFFSNENKAELKIGIDNTKYREDYIFSSFVTDYKSKYEENKYLWKEEFELLQNSLIKEANVPPYVIDMAKIDDYNKIIKPKDYSKEDLMKSGTVKFCDENKLSVVKDVLYQIRCNIFHGEKIPGEPNDDRIVQAAFPLLKGIVEFLISDLKIEDK